MATVPISPVQPSTPHGGATARAVRRKRIKRAMRRHVGRIWRLLLVLALPLPLLITSLLDRH